MAKNYDDYGYEKDNRSESTSITRKILIIVLIVIAIFLILYLVKSCSSRPNKPSNPSEPAVTPTEPVVTPVEPNKTNNEYETMILEAGKNYFIKHSDQEVKNPGECKNVDLKTLINDGLVESKKFYNCSVTSSYIRVCMLEDKSKQYTPWVSCVSKKSEDEYGTLTEGTSANVISDVTYVEFKFLPQYLKKAGENLGPTEEYWKGEVPYKNYKTLATIDYYRYRDKLFIWNLTKRTYYSTEGDKSSSGETSEYYTSSPKSGYTKQSDKTTEAYKWYESKSEKAYYTVNGEKALSASAVGEYKYKDPVGVDIVRYRTRTVTSTYLPYLYNICSTNATNTRVIYQYDPCGKGSNKSYTYNRGTVYSCASPTAVDESIIGNIVPSKTSTCKKYSSWSSPTTTACDTSKTDICQKAVATLYYWYKPVNETRTYYPSGSKTASGEKTYYTEAPVKGAIKDTSTRVTAYKWYKETTTTSSQYLAVAPSGYTTATRTGNSILSDWSSWSTDNPKTNDGRDRQIENKQKIRLQEIRPSASDEWLKLSDNYISEKEMISLYKNKGYNVKTIEDINGNGELKYQTIMYVRNKKEIN